MADTYVRSLQPHEVDSAAAALAVSFATDPILRWIRPTSDAHADQQTFRALLLAKLLAPQGTDVSVDGNQIVGVAAWAPPRYHPPLRQAVRGVPGLLATARTNPRGAVALAYRTSRAAPREPHWYLSTLGAVIPGRGIGSALLRRGLERVTGPAYLESSNVKNVPLYQRFGFQVQQEITFRGGPTLWTMYRPAP